MAKKTKKDELETEAAPDVVLAEPGVPDGGTGDAKLDKALSVAAPPEHGEKARLLKVNLKDDVILNGVKFAKGKNVLIPEEAYAAFAPVVYEE